MRSICLDASFFFVLWLARLPSHRPELTSAPYPDAEITLSACRQAAGSHISPYIPSLRVCRSDRRNSCKNMVGWLCPRLYLGWSSSENWVEPLIIRPTHHHPSVCPSLSYHHRRAFSVFFFCFFFSVHQFYPIPQQCPMRCILLPPLIFSGSSGFSALTADEVLQMKPYSCTPDHSPQTMATPDMISTTILPICRSGAMGL